jgi:hypothetical protein
VYLSQLWENVGMVENDWGRRNERAPSMSAVRNINNHWSVVSRKIWWRRFYWIGHSLIGQLYWVWANPKLPINVLIGQYTQSNNKIFYYSTYNFTIRNLQIFLYNFAGKNNNSSPKHKTTKVPITFKRIELSRLKKKKNLN